MKILWLTNIAIPVISRDIGIKNHPSGGWLMGMLDPLIKNSSMRLMLCFPFNKELSGNTDTILYSSFIENRNTKNRFIQIIQEYKPDIIHIFGTEYKHTLDMVDAAIDMGMIGRLVINIQGFAGACSEHYLDGLPKRVVYGFTLRDFLKIRNIYLEKKNFEKRGRYENLALKKAKYVIGRTEWDNTYIHRINPDLTYFHCNETLRSAFYNNIGSWQIEKCNQHSVFTSQSGYPIKGFHYLIKAFSIIVKDYPDAHLYTTGRSPFGKSIRESIKFSSYDKYKAYLIKKYALEGKVTFLGALNEDEMCDRYKKSHVFICPSSIENSSNSVCEAMMIGVPVIASSVGGLTSLIKDKTDGFLYQYNDPLDCANLIKKVFESEEIAKRVSNNAIEVSNIRHDIITNYNNLIEIYRSIISWEKNFGEKCNK